METNVIAVSLYDKQWYLMSSCEFNFILASWLLCLLPSLPASNVISENILESWYHHLILSILRLSYIYEQVNARLQVYEIIFYYLFNSLAPSDTIWRQRLGSKAITWTNVDLSTLRSHGIHPRALSWEDLKMNTKKQEWNHIQISQGPILIKRCSYIQDQYLSYIAKRNMQRICQTWYIIMHSKQVYSLNVHCKIECVSAVLIIVTSAYRNLQCRYSENVTYTSCVDIILIFPLMTS